jgi:hypothetical protein
MLPGISECRSVLIDPFEHLHTYILQLIYDGNEQIDTLRRPPGVLRRPGDGRHHRHELLPRRPIPLRPQRHRLRCNGKGRPQRRAPARRNRRHPVQEVWYACCSALLSLISNYIRIALSLSLSSSPPLLGSATVTNVPSFLLLYYFFHHHQVFSFFFKIVKKKNRVRT